LGVKVIRERDVKEFVEGEDRRAGVKRELEEKRKNRLLGEGKDGEEKENDDEEESESLDREKESMYEGKDKDNDDMESESVVDGEEKGESVKEGNEEDKAETGVKRELGEQRKMRLLGEEKGGEKTDESVDDGDEADSESMDDGKSENSESVDGKKESMDEDKAEADSMDESVDDKDQEEDKAETESMDVGEDSPEEETKKEELLAEDASDVNADEDAPSKREVDAPPKREEESMDESENDSMDDVENGSVDDEDKEEDKAETESTDVDDEDSPKKEIEKEESPAEVTSDANANIELKSGVDVDFIVQGDIEDKPLLDQLAVCEPGYHKVYSVGLLPPPLPPPSTPSPSSGKEVPKEKQVIKVTMPIASTTDDHEVSEEGEFIANSAAPPSTSSRLPFSLYGSAPSRVLHPKERSVEWKRWTKEMCEKIPEQVTFDELGIGGVGCVFDLEQRLKRKFDEEAAGVNDDVKPEQEKEANRGKGKVLRKSSPEKAEQTDEAEEDEDVVMIEPNELAKADKNATTEEIPKGKKETEKGADNKKEATTKDLPKKSTKTFSLVPLPSFHYQDLQRIKILQNEMVNYRAVQTVREKILKIQIHYEKTYKVSIELQQTKATAMVDFNTLIEANRAEVASMEQSGKSLMKAAKSHWDRRQFQRKDMASKLGAELAHNRNVANDVLQDLKDRVCIRTAEKLTGSGLGTHRLKMVAEGGKSEGDESREVSATVLGHVIDCVERRHQDALANSSHFIPPQVASAESVIADPKTGETMAQVHARKVVQLKKNIQQLDVRFKEAEKRRGEAWLTLSRAKGVATGGSGAGGQPAGGAKPKARSRKSVGTPGSHGGAANARVAAAAAIGLSSSGGSRQPYPMQMQTRPTQPTQPTRQSQPRPAQPNAPRPSAPGSVPVPGYIPASYYQGRPGPPSAASMMAAASARGVPTTASMMAAQMAAAASGYVQSRVAQGQVAQGRVATSTAAAVVAMGGNHARIAQIAMQSMMAQQPRSLQQQQPQRPGGGSGGGARVVVQGGPTNSGLGGGVQFHPVVQNLPSQKSAPAAAAAASSGPPAGGPVAASSVASSAAVATNDAAAAVNQDQRTAAAQAVAAAVATTEAQQPLTEPKTTTLSKYGYGDKYSTTNVNARKNPDGTVIPASTPKLLPDGRFARPAGRQRKGMDWDSVNGWWVPLAEGQQPQVQQGGSGGEQQGGESGGGNEGDTDSQQGNTEEGKMDES